MRKLLLILPIIFTACASGAGTQIPEAPEGAVAWCGDFEYIGTWLKAQSAGRGMGISNTELAEQMTIEDIVALAEALGCNQILR